MTLTLKRHSRLAMQLEFLEPDMPNARIEFDIEQAAGHCMLNWHMYGEPPCAMDATILNRVSMDCERGLAMLKEYIERGEVLSSVSIDGLCELARQDYVGISNRSMLRELPPEMQADFDKLYTLFRENDWPLDVIPFSIYHAMQSSDTKFVSAIPVSTIPADLAEPFTTGSITIARGFRVTHTGAYENLGNAWSAAIRAAYLHGHKPLTGPVGIERYHNDHETLPAAQLITEVIVPVA
jgi:effector-binding domain-containing protein